MSDHLITQIHTIANRCDELERLLTDARALRRMLIRQAHREGHQPPELAAHAHISRAAIHKIVNR